MITCLTTSEQILDVLRRGGRIESTRETYGIWIHRLHGQDGAPIDTWRIAIDQAVAILARDGRNVTTIHAGRCQYRIAPTQTDPSP